MKPIKNIVILGTGNVSWHLSRALFKHGFSIDQIYGRDPNKAQHYAEAVRAEAISSLEDLNTGADLYLLCISDNNISEVASLLPKLNGIVAHTSGSAPISLLNTFENYGVFYPLQTFSKGVDVNFKTVPVLFEGNNEKVEKSLHSLAQTISQFAFQVTSEKREKLHVAAVFVNNFSNHLFTQAYTICQENNVPFETLHALIKETARKALIGNPAEIQTGPAIRGDEKTIKRHLELLPNSAQKELYKTLTNSIKKER